MQRIPTPIEQLIIEHGIIEMVLHALSGMSQRLDRGEHIQPSAFYRIFDFLVDFADRRHHRKEERCLFPALGLQGVPRDTGPLGMLLQEHCTGRALIAQMKRAASALGNGDPAAAAQFAELARTYVELLREHIQKENNVLFRLAGKLLDERSLQSVQDDFDEAEPDLAAAHVRYQHEAEELERAWAL